MNTLFYDSSSNSVSSASISSSLTKELADLGRELQEKENLPLYFLSLGGWPAVLPPEERTRTCEIGNCQFRVWVSCTVTAEGRVEWRSFSDSRLVSGVLCLILGRLEGKALSELLAIDWIAVEQAWPGGVLATGRGGSLHTLLAHISRAIRKTGL